MGESSKKTVNGSEKHFLYVGSFCSDESKDCGIGVYAFDPESGAAEYLETVHKEIHAGGMYIDREKNVLYTVDERKENPDLGGQGGGRVYAFAIDRQTGALTEINHRNSFGSMPSYLTVDKTGKYLLVCHYSHTSWCTKVAQDEGGGYKLELIYSDCPIPLYPLGEDGSIGEPCDILKVPPVRGNDVCFHSIQRSPDGNFFAACSLKQAKLLFLRINEEAHRLEICSSLDFERGTRPRTGHSPRYGVFHPSKKLFYFNSEYVPRLTTVRYDDCGGLETVRIQDAAPKLPGMENTIITMSDLCISADGKYLYALYRLVNVICTFRIDGESGLPEMIQSLHLTGEGPRGMRLSPDGRFLLIANLGSKDVTTLKVQADGMVKELSRAFGQEYPANLEFYDP